MLFDRRASQVGPRSQRHEQQIRNTAKDDTVDICPNVALISRDQVIGNTMN